MSSLGQSEDDLHDVPVHHTAVCTLCFFQSLEKFKSKIRIKERRENREIEKRENKGMDRGGKKLKRKHVFHPSASEFSINFQSLAQLSYINQSGVRSFFEFT